MILDKASQSFNFIWGPHPSHSLLYFHFQPLLVPHVSTSQPNGVLIWVIFLITFPNDAVFVGKSNYYKTHPSPRMPSSFLSSHQIRSDDFDEYDPTPYGGGYDQVLTYGRPLEPTDETFYPSSY